MKSRFLEYSLPKLKENNNDIISMSKQLEELQDGYSDYNLNIDIILNPVKQIAVDTFNAKKLNQDTMTELQNDIIEIIENNRYELDYIDNIKGKIVFFIKQ